MECLLVLVVWVEWGAPFAKRIRRAGDARMYRRAEQSAEGLGVVKRFRREAR